MKKLKQSLKEKMEYDTWDLRYHNDDHSIISALLTRFGISIHHRLHRIFLKMLQKYMPLNLFLQYCDLYGTSIVFNAMEVCRNSDLLMSLKQLIAAVFQRTEFICYNGRCQEVTISCIWYICCWECFLSDYLSD